MDTAYNFRRLLVIAAVAENGGVRRASLRLNMSQPAISQAIGNLERDLGEPLFHRRPDGMFPTPGAALFISRIGRAIAHLRAGEREVRPGRAAAPPLHRLATTVQWRALLAVLEHGGFAAAARALGLSQPSIHRSARDLERLCGRPLFRTGPAGAELTPQGRMLARHASLAIREIEQGLDELREQRGLNDGAVVVGSLPLSRTHIVPAAVTRLLSERPDARIRIVDGAYDELLDGLRHGRIDMIVGALRLPSAPGLTQEMLFEEPLSIIVRAGHPILTEPSPSIEALRDLEWVAPNDRAPARVSFNAFFRGHGVEPPQRIVECSSLMAIRGLLLLSDRAAFLSASQIPFESPAAELAVAPFALAGTERSIGICMRGDWAPTGTQTRLMTLIREIAARDREAAVLKGPDRGRQHRPSPGKGPLPPGQPYIE